MPFGIPPLVVFYTTRCDRSAARPLGRPRRGMGADSRASRNRSPTARSSARRSQVTRRCPPRETASSSDDRSSPANASASRTPMPSERWSSLVRASWTSAECGIRRATPRRSESTSGRGKWESRLSSHLCGASIASDDIATLYDLTRKYLKIKENTPLSARRFLFLILKEQYGK